MIIITLLLIRLILGIPESPFVIQKSEKIILENVEDKERKKEVKVAIKAFMKEWKKKQKVQNKENKEIRKLLTDRASDTTEILLRTDATMEELRRSNESLADLRLQVLELLTEEEWQNALVEMSDEKPKKRKKRTKAELKSQLKQQKRFKELRTNLSSSFEESGRKAESMKVLDDFEESLSSLLSESQGQAQKVLEVMNNKYATREAVLSITTGYEQLKIKSTQAILDLRNDLLLISDDKTWTSVSKDLARFLTY